VLLAYRKLFKQSGRFDNLVHDQGKEYLNLKFKKFVSDELKSKQFPTYGEKGAAIVERYNKEIKSLLVKDCALRASYRWIDSLKKITEIINKRKHSRWNLAPSQINERNQKIIKYYYKNNFRKAKPKFKLNEYVKIALEKEAFEKSYYFKNSFQNYRICEVSKKFPERYRLYDEINAKQLPRQYYEKELVKVKDKDSYLVEVLRQDKRRKKVLVNFIGIPNQRHWMNEDEIF
jgi:hypothetical protein